VKALKALLKNYFLAFPLGQLPVLEVDGKKMNQSISICRFLAKKVGLAGKTDYENYEIDSVIDTIVDLRTSKFVIIADVIANDKLCLSSRNGCWCVREGSSY